MSRSDPPPIDAEAAARRWQAANQRYNLAAIAVLRARLQGDHGDPLRLAERARDEAAAHLPSPAAIVRVAELFALSDFERDLLLLCAGVELEPDLAAACATAHGDARRLQPTFGLALARLPGAYWSAIGPSGALRRYRLIEVGQGEALARCPLRIDERVLHYLAGIHQPDERTAAFLEPGPVAEPLPPSHQRVCERIVALWRDAATLPLVQLAGEDGAAKRAIAAAVAQALEMRLAILPATTLSGGHDAALPLLLTREAILSGTAFLIDADELRDGDAAALQASRRLLQKLEGPAFVAARDPLRIGQRATVTFTVARPSSIEQAGLWRRGLRERLTEAEASRIVAPLVAQFDLPAPAIQNACAGLVGAPHPETAQLLWDACLVEARPRLDELAQRIESTAGWADLVLPAAHKALLNEIAIHVRQRRKVYGSWGFASKGQRGLGISALFAGASGTGKTMAAEVLGRELRLDVYRIDLSQVVSKYIGETEKNLRRVFDAAEHGGAILLFDEADALFGQRSEVKDSHDRFANIEVGYLLQRMEAYRGLAILTTNLKNSLDTAFLRRLRFVVQFPFPSATERAEIWRRVFPGETPTEGLDCERLARLNLAGGSIRNVAMNAAFIAAEADEPVRMPHILKAAQTEYAKLERPFAGSETI